MLGLSVAWAARKPGDPLRPGFNLFSRQDDVTVGQENAKQVLQQYEVVKNPFVQEYVQRLGQKLAAMPEAKQSGFEFSFTVLNVDEINAFALPGGPMFIYTGLLKALDNEAQLAGVMGHEMSHVILRHGTHEATKANGIQLLVGGVAGLLGGGSDSTAGKLAQAGLGMAGNSVILKFSRDAESEADALGSHLMSEAGYDPVQMAKFFEKLAGNGQRSPQFLSDHPNPGNREAAIQAEMSTLPARQYGTESGQFARMKKEVAALSPPVKKAQAGAPGPGSSVPPAGHAAEGFRLYQGKRFSMQYPDGWQATDGDEVTLAPRDGVVQQHGGSQVGFGVLIGTFAAQRGRGDLRAATEDLIRKLKGGNPKLQVNGAAKSVTMGRADGLVTMLSEDSPFGGGEVDELTTVARPGGVMYFVFVAPERDYERVEKTFQAMRDSVSFGPN
jgi:hypothetical protein